MVEGRGCCGALVHTWAGGAALGRPPQHRRLDREIDREKPARRHRHHRLGLRHDHQGLRLHVPRDAAYAERRRNRGLAKDISEFSPTSAGAATCGRTSWSPITRPARSSTGRRSEPAEDAAAQAGLHRRDARGTSLLRLGRHLQHLAARDRDQLRDRKVANIVRASRRDVIATGNIGCMMQIGRHDLPLSTRSSCSTGPPAGLRPRRSAS